jgi:hypothetical protein
MISAWEAQHNRYFLVRGSRYIEGWYSGLQTSPHTRAVLSAMPEELEGPSVPKVRTELVCTHQLNNSHQTPRAPLEAPKHAVAEKTAVTETVRRPTTPLTRQNTEGADISQMIQTIVTILLVAAPQVKTPRASQPVISTGYVFSSLTIGARSACRSPALKTRSQSAFAFETHSTAKVGLG